jgi:hypothetical protein
MTKDKKGLSKCKTIADSDESYETGFSWWSIFILVLMALHNWKGEVTDFQKNLLPATAGLKWWKSSTKGCLTVLHGNSNSSCCGLAYVNNLRLLCTTVMLILSQQVRICDILYSKPFIICYSMFHSYIS